MRFFDYPDNWLAFKSSGLADAMGVVDRAGMYAKLVSAQNQIGFRHLMFDKLWNAAGRPYYDVYPAIIPMLTKLNLDFPGSVVSGVSGVMDFQKSVEFRSSFLSQVDDDDWGIGGPGVEGRLSEFRDYVRSCPRKIKHLLIRLPEAQHDLFYEDPRVGRTAVRTIFASFQPMSQFRGKNRMTMGLVVGIDIGERDVTGVLPQHTIHAFPLDDRSVDDCIMSLPKHPAADVGMIIPQSLSMSCIRLVVTLFLLEDNAELIEPDVLAKDRFRVNGADEELFARLVEKAKKRGKYGFVVGRALSERVARGEMSPHTRAPHLALFWEGPGRKIPVIKLRDGSLIHRKKVLDVPTGYQGTVE